MAAESARHANRKGRCRDERRKIDGLADPDADRRIHRISLIRTACRNAKRDRGATNGDTNERLPLAADHVRKHGLKIAFADAPRPPAEISDWFDECTQLPIDPEAGPGWRLSVLPVTDGSTAINLVLSHYVIALLGMRRFLEIRGLGWASTAFGSLTFVLGGYTISLLNMLRLRLLERA